MTTTLEEVVPHAVLDRKEAKPGRREFSTAPGSLLAPRASRGGGGPGRTSTEDVARTRGARELPGVGKVATDRTPLCQDRSSFIPS